METIYCTTRNFIRHEGNLVDLTAYRQKLGQVSGACALAPWPMEETVQEAPVRPAAPAKAKKRRRGKSPLGQWLELTASAVTVVLVATAWVQFLF